MNPTQPKETLRQAFRAVVEPLLVPVGWWNRLIVVLGTYCILTTRITNGIFSGWGWMVLYSAIWLIVYQFNLANAYWRGSIDAHRGNVGGELREMVELEVNAKLVALEDLAKLCLKYGIPLSEVTPIIERGIGMKIVDDE
jgi:hypothetical protein